MVRLNDSGWASKKNHKKATYCRWYYTSDDPRWCFISENRSSRIICWAVINLWLCHFIHYWALKHQSPRAKKIPYLMLLRTNIVRNLGTVHTVSIKSRVMPWLPFSKYSALKVKGLLKTTFMQGWKIWQQFWEKNTELGKITRNTSKTKFEFHCGKILTSFLVGSLFCEKKRRFQSLFHKSLCALSRLHHIPDECCWSLGSQKERLPFNIVFDFRSILWHF